MIEDKKKFFAGFGLMIGFIVIFIILFSPVFNGQNGLSYLDNLYNSISKGSAYYVPKVTKAVKPFKGTAVNAMIVLETEKTANEIAGILTTAGITATATSKGVNVSGDIGKLMLAAIKDADLMYHNKGDEISSQYGSPAKQVMYGWWMAFKAMSKALKDQKQFKEADVLALVQAKVIETSYNYYGIEPQKIMDRLWVVIFSLLFYVIYTVWYGFAFMLMFEGWGMKLGH